MPKASMPNSSVHIHLSLVEHLVPCYFDVSMIGLQCMGWERVERGHLREKYEIDDLRVPAGGVGVGVLPVKHRDVR